MFVCCENIVIQGDTSKLLLSRFWKHDKTNWSDSDWVWRFPVILDFKKALLTGFRQILHNLEFFPQPVHKGLFKLFGQLFRSSSSPFFKGSKITGTRHTNRHSTETKRALAWVEGQLTTHTWAILVPGFPCAHNVHANSTPRAGAFFQAGLELWRMQTCPCSRASCRKFCFLKISNEKSKTTASPTAHLAPLPTQCLPVLPGPWRGVQAGGTPRHQLTNCQCHQRRDQPGSVRDDKCLFVVKI